MRCKFVNILWKRCRSEVLWLGVLPKTRTRYKSQNQRSSTQAVPYGCMYSTVFGSYQHRDASGKVTGHSDPGMFGGYSHSDSEGCYVATCMYGSYDCPQVWTLRRFRDNILGKNVLGRAFIRTYYATSPAIVRRFGDTAWFRTMWRSVLDGMVRRLNGKGVENTPYRDKGWR